MPSYDFSQIPRPLGFSIFLVVFTHGFSACWIYFALGSFREGGSGWIWGIVFLVIGLLLLRSDSAKEVRGDLAQSWRQRRAIRLTKQLKGFFRDQLEEETPYIGGDLTQGHELRVMRVDKRTTLLYDPTGCYTFEHFAVATWAPTVEALDAWHPQPATAEQLEGIIHRLRTYR